ncbi:DUF3558 family protein [Gordonia terrae]|uniref:DUF3558 family protein n=1 Tax=Gordonia terrae TaxID=2055 RepID=UPI003F6C8A28
MLLAAAVVGLSATGCAVEGQPVANRDPLIPASSSSVPVRQTDASGNVLPFATNFPNRWNANNDGTSYESCTAVTGETLRANGLDERSVADVAKSDRQTARGCSWKAAGEPRIIAEQFVANLLPGEFDLTGYKGRNAAGMQWLADTSIDGRRVAIGSMTKYRCATYLVSGKAVVVTAVNDYTKRGTNTAAICQRALSFTRSVVDEIPR